MGRFDAQGESSNLKLVRKPAGFRQLTAKEVLEWSLRVAAIQ